MMDFVFWWMSTLPDFLMSEPICYLVAFYFLFVIGDIVSRMMHVGR